MKNKTKKRKEIIDQRLHEAVMNSKPEQTFTYQQISELTSGPDGKGLSHERIRQIELSALAKVKKIALGICESDGIEYQDLFHQ